ncbi:hypothetical protein RJ641_011978 [Dillenia turbinata]|uniref:At3g05675-like ankyrin-like domain-containing protein n=1 Tax=Dillenia turbinata TaxID=194707 RepID=A0AAN8V0K2_9MAGN
METNLALVPVSAARGRLPKPTALLNSIFMSTVNVAAKTLVAVSKSMRVEEAEKWKLLDHLRFMVMLMTWFTLWVLRVLMDHIPWSIMSSSSSGYHLGGSVSSSSLDYLSSMSSSSSNNYDYDNSNDNSSFSTNLVLHDGVESVNLDAYSIKALGRALSHIFTLLSEMPATSRKYQFAVSMADKIMDENMRDGNVQLQRINRIALASALARTSALLHRSLQTTDQLISENEGSIWLWPMRLIGFLPLGSYMAASFKGLRFVANTLFPMLLGGGAMSTGSQKRLQLEDEDDVVAEKLAQELMWITNKMRNCGVADEALMQWSFASGLASLALSTNPRVQGFIVKITAILLAEACQGNYQVPREVKFRLLVLWLPLFCYAGNGFAYPVLSRYEKIEMERAMNELMSTLSPRQQEIVLTNWLQDYTNSTSDWPNLQLSYDHWCQSSRKIIS